MTRVAYKGARLLQDGFTTYGTEQDAMMILTNSETGIAVKLETDSLGAVTLTHISFEPNALEKGEGDHTIEVKKFTGALAWDRALGYAKLCVAYVIPAGTSMRVGY